MKLSLFSVLLSAGLAISQVNGATVWLAQDVRKSASLDHAVVAKPNMAVVHISMKPWAKLKGGCTGSFRNKAANVSAWFKYAFGIAPPPQPNEIKQTAHSTIMASHIEETYTLPAGVYFSHHRRPLQVNHHYGKIYPQPFSQRLTRALMLLGPWEGRILAFVIGCGVGVLVRMFWVLTVLLIRSMRGPRRDEEFLADEVIFEEHQHLIPPQYTEVQATAEIKEKN